MDAREKFAEDAIDLMDYIRPLLSRWKLLLAVFVVGGVLAYLGSSFLPKMYTSSATVYVQQSSGGLSMLKDLPVAIPGASTGNTGYIMTLLNSDSLKLAIIKKLGLSNNKIVFPQGAKSEVEAARKFGGLMEATESKNGSVTITVTAGDPQLAMDIANAAVDILGTMVVTASSHQTSFLSKRLDETVSDLEKAEKQMMEFMKQNDVASIDDQTKELVVRLGDLDGQILAVQTQLEGLTSELQNSGNLSSLADKEVQKKSLEASIAYLQQQRDGLKSKLTNLPTIGAQYARLQRQVMMLSKTYELLTQQYQLAKVTQKGEDGDYQIIDRAMKDDKEVSPRKAMNAVGGALAALFIAAVIIDLSAAKKHAPRPPRGNGRSSLRKAEVVEKS